MRSVTFILQRQRFAGLGNTLLQLLIEEQAVSQVDVQLRVCWSNFRRHAKIRDALRALVQLQPQQTARTQQGSILRIRRQLGGQVAFRLFHALRGGRKAARLEPATQEQCAAAIFFRKESYHLHCSKSRRVPCEKLKKARPGQPPWPRKNKSNVAQPRK